METFKEESEKILAELKSNDSEIRLEYFEHFGDKIESFSNATAQALSKWRLLDIDCRNDKRRAHISALVFTAVNLHINSMKLFLSGQSVAAGNLFRQVIEAMALALLCSGKELGILERFMNDKYSANDAVRDVLRHSKNFDLKEDSVKVLRDVQGFYHQYSHVSLLTITTVMSFTEDALYMGAAFDKGKYKGYDKEVNGRVNLATILPNFIDGVRTSVAKW